MLINELIVKNNKEETIINLQKSDIEIGMIEFSPEKYVNNLISDYTQIGNFELDIIAINNKNKNIVILDHDQPNFIMQTAANDLFLFLEGLSIIESFYNECENNDKLYDDFKRQEKVAEKAALKAGGNSFIDFYKCIFGI